ncbi:MAG: cobalamin-binding protein [Anaerolineales bacterium]|nr:MAG: cobalamin-binding protein [Anaerolineales bacterium]
MYKTYCVLVIAVILLTVATACGPSSVPQPTDTPAPSLTPTPELAAFPLTMTDDLGNEVTIEAEPQRIVSMAPSHTQTLYALGLGDKVVGVTEYCSYPPEAQEKPKVGGFSNIDLEQVVGLDPDLVLGTSLHAQSVRPALVERGLKVVLINPQTVEDVLEKIVLVGRVTGREGAAIALSAELRGRIEATMEKVQGTENKPRVYWELSNDLYTAGPGSFIDDLIVRAGGINIAADTKEQWPQLNLEALILADPEVIVLADHPYGETAEGVKARPGWADVSAVKNERIVEVLDDDLVSQPGPRVAEALEFVAKALHPELFVE